MRKYLRRFPALFGRPTPAGAGLLIGSILLMAVPWAAATANEERSPITHGLMVGAVTHDSAIVWSRSDRETTLHVWLQAIDGGIPLHMQGPVMAAHDFTGKLAFQGLKPETEYQYAVRFGGDSSPPRHDPVSGSFRTAPAPRTKKAVRFLWGSDLAGQNVCRDAHEGFPMFPVLSRSRWDFFVAVGDMIYADMTCEQRGKYGNEQIPARPSPASTLEDFWAVWKYTRLDRGFQDFLTKTPYFPVWDDHEVLDDFGPLHDTATVKSGTSAEHLLPVGLAAFLDYNALTTDKARPLSLYRTLRWGQHVELFLLDTRQYRDANAAEDRTERPKTMLGREQLAWLKNRLTASEATWKFIISSVPLATPTGGLHEKGRDGWANGEQKTGFERELSELVSFMKVEGLRNVVWLSGDTHSAQGLRFRPFSKDSPFIMYEFTSGPMNAGLFVNRTLDTSLRPERLFFFGPENPTKIGSLAQAKEWMNTGAIEVSDTGTLVVKIINAAGRTVVTSEPFVPR
jgi:alkaline phosphatase D